MCQTMDWISLATRQEEDQATYELALAIRNKDEHMFGNMILLLGGFHQAHNYMNAIFKIMRGCGAEEILVNAGSVSKEQPIRYLE